MLAYSWSRILCLSCAEKGPFGIEEKPSMPTQPLKAVEIFNQATGPGNRPPSPE